jgi:hypothetical protein
MRISREIHPPVESHRLNADAYLVTGLAEHFSVQRFRRKVQGYPLIEQPSGLNTTIPKASSQPGLGICQYSLGNIPKFLAV